jgi:CelD/BcsL family acetyltransferase involved in cellulose biosynthesis
MGGASVARSAVPKSVSRSLTAECADAARYARLTSEWDSLVSRAVSSNVSMHPAVVSAAAASGADVRVILVWRSVTGDETRELVGVWALALERLYRRWPSLVLVSPVNRHLILGAPVVDNEIVEETLSAMLGALAAGRSTPALMRVAEFPAHGGLYEALRRILARRCTPLIVQRSLVRPKLTASADPDVYLEATLSTKRRRELRRSWRRLGEMGAVEVTIHRAQAEVAENFEDFLALEASGWKGGAGTALALRGRRTRTFAQEMINGLARHGCVTIMALRLNGQPIAMEVLLRCGSVAHTWKSAYDETFKSLGPGLLLFEKVTRRMLGETSLAYADMSNNREFPDALGVSTFWGEQHEVVDLLVGLRPSAWALAQLRCMANPLR